MTGLIVGAMKELLSNTSILLSGTITWELRAESKDKTFSTKVKGGMSFEKRVKSALKQEGVDFIEKRDGSVILRFRSDVVPFLAFATALSQHDPDLMKLLTKDCPADVTVRQLFVFPLIIVQFSIMNIEMKVSQNAPSVSEAKEDGYLTKKDLQEIFAELRSIREDIGELQKHCGITPKRKASSATALRRTKKPKIEEGVVQAADEGLVAFK